MRLLLPLIGAAAMIGVAAPAYADDNDDRFLAELRHTGITYQDPAAAISAARTVCSLVDQGYSDADIVNTLQVDNPAFQGNGAAEFTTIAAAHYCPKDLAPAPGG